MKKIKLGNTNEQISCMALGTMYFGSKVDEQTSFSILDYYVENGGSLIDSANKYASWIPGFEGGESELLIGKWLQKKGNRNDMFLTSKVGLPYGEIPRSLKKEIVISECERSLKRLGVETIDLYFAHAYDAKTPVDEVMEAFLTLKKQGKIRFAGASNHLGWQLAEAAQSSDKLDFEGFTCLQQRHTYLEPGLRANFSPQLLLTPEIEEYCQTKNLTIMAYSTLLGGAYVNDQRPVPIQYQTAATQIRLESLKQIANELGVSGNAIVLRWMMQSTPAVIPIATGSSLLQMEDNMSAIDIHLSQEQMDELNKELVQPEKYS